MVYHGIDIQKGKIADFCKERHINRFSIFGSLISPDFNPDSDIDVLVEFAPEHIPSLLKVVRLERELSVFFDGRKVDLRTPEDLSDYFRDDVIASAKVQYSND